MNDEQEEQKVQADYNYDIDGQHSFNSNYNDLEIGKTIASEKFLNNMDSFWFALNENTIINSFDFVSVNNFHNIKTIGIVKELQAVMLSDYNLDQRVLDNDLAKKKPADTFTAQSSNNFRRGITVAKVAVMTNTTIGIKKTKAKVVSIGMPVGIGKPVKFATAQEIIQALGIPEMRNAIPAGIIEMTNGLQVPISLDISYLAGPDTAHVNASGISGNMKTSYLLFLLQSASQKLGKKNELAIIIFNTKEEDLLHIDKENHTIKEGNKKLFNILNLDIEPFNNVTYFLPRGKDGKPNSVHIPPNSKTYSYELEDIYDRLDLLFQQTYDPHYNLSSIINYIYESWPIKDNSGEDVRTWTDLFEFRDYPQEIITHKSTLLHFLGTVQRFRKSSMFIDHRVTSIYLGKEIKRINSGDIFVIDIATISALEEQAFIVGDVMKTIDEMYSERYYSSINDNKDKKPKYIFIFIDEINRFLPKSIPNERMSAVAEQIMKTVIAGKSRGTILFSAQQFKSGVDNALHENTGMHITAKLGFSELSTTSYVMIDETTRMNIVRLNKGEIVMIHSAFRHPIKIIFPISSFKRT
jgi:DNA helicase HerA-like ATPase